LRLVALFEIALCDALCLQRKSHDLLANDSVRRFISRGPRCYSEHPKLRREWANSRFCHWTTQLRSCDSFQIACRPFEQEISILTATCSNFWESARQLFCDAIAREAIVRGWANTFSFQKLQAAISRRLRQFRNPLSSTSPRFQQLFMISSLRIYKGIIKRKPENIEVFRHWECITFERASVLAQFHQKSFCTKHQQSLKRPIVLDGSCTFLFHSFLFLVPAIYGMRTSQ
jgi:hypothetical protein